MPRVSIIIPAYNAETHLAEALESVRAQSFADREAIVVDDGSTDGTRDVAARFADCASIVSAGRNEGLPAARNRGIAAARGELVAFLDADDAWEPDYLEQMVAAYDREQARHGDVGIVACDATVVDEHGVPTGETHSQGTGHHGPVTVEALLTGNPIFVGALCPASVVREVGGFEPGMRLGAEDHDLWLRIVERGYRVVQVPRPLARYRRSTASMSADLGRMARAAQQVLARALARGGLDRRRRRAAERQLRLQRGIEDVERALRAPGRPGPRTVLRMLRAACAFAAVAVRRPDRWAAWSRALLGARATLWRPDTRQGRSLPLRRSRG